MPTQSATMRRGLPRHAGGEPWPPTAAAPARRGPVSAATVIAVEPPPGGRPPGVRRGLPRVPGGEPWPPPAAAMPIFPRAETATDPPAIPVRAPSAAAVDVLSPLPWTRSAWAGPAASGRGVRSAPPRRIRGRTLAQWVAIAVLGGGGLLFAAFMAVVFTRWLVSLDGMQDFLAAYPGETHLPAWAPVGIPAWLGWQHFFNVFLMVLIIRSGLQVRMHKRPPLQWSPRWNPQRKISINLWFHQSLDLLWVINGVIFVALLIVTGQWTRVVPTSWEVIPNAISAAIQYVSLDWPTENGWVNYNSLQVLAYFTTIFVAAPLAAVTGVRMSGLWPTKNARLSRLYPLEWARALHFPVMLYFVAFIIVHVALVFATGALRNLNHMFAAQGSVDPAAYVASWTGFWMFFAALVVIVIGWIAARSIVLSGIARLFGRVSGY